MREDERPMTREQAERYKQQLSMLSPSHVEDTYHRAFSDCALHDGRPPSPAMIQRLLCVWKVLWQWQARQKTR